MYHQHRGIGRRSVLGAVGIAATMAALPSVAWAAPRGRYASGAAHECAQRADLAEHAIVARHVRPLWGLPEVLLGVVAWPASWPEQAFESWHYWWQAHLLDCAVDAANRAPGPERLGRVAALAHGIRSRNLTGWTNEYYDDMAWLVLALERADRLLGIGFPDGVADLRTALVDGWDPIVGAMVWRVGDDYYNTPSNGPTGIAMARFGHVPRSERIADFLHTRLREPETGLIVDGVHEPGNRVEHTIYSYCQGVTIGVETELSSRTDDVEHHNRAVALIDAVDTELTDDGVIAAATGGDKGLFMGILSRYLAEAALTLGSTTAADIVHASANAAWQHRAEVDGLPLFGVDWTVPATAPEGPEDLPQLTGSVETSQHPGRDLSVQLSGWMVLEADHRITAAGL